MKPGIRKIILLFIPVIFFSITATAQLIKHSYRFYNDLAVSLPECGPDLIPTKVAGTCGGAATSGGNFITDNLPYCGLSRTVYHNNLHWGLQYPNTSGTVTNKYTIHLYVKTTNFGATWARIIDFSNGSSDGGIYFRTSGTSSGRCLDFFPNGIVGTCPYFNNSTYYLLTFTRDAATGKIDVYVNSTLFVSYNDIAGKYVGTSGTPIYIFRDDNLISCESGEANFAYLSFTNQYSSQADVNAVYNDICTLANATGSADFSINPASSCALTQNITVTYTGDIAAPGNGYLFNWNWDGGTVISGSGMGPYLINWNTTGTKNLSLNVTSVTCGLQSIKTKQFIIGSGSTTTLNQSICQGQSYNGYNTTGTFRDTFPGIGGCDSIVTLNLLVKQPSASTITQTICNGQSFLGRTTAGVYKDTLIAANGCDSVRTLDLTVINNPLPDLGADTALCKGDTLKLSAGAFLSYLWQDGSTQNNFIVRQAGIYSVTVTGNCGLATDNITITELQCEIYFPTGFTPNGDGTNDEFSILNAYGVTEFELAMYNRFGQKVFQTNNYNNGWDGKFKGKAQNSGVYIWYCTYKKNNIAFVKKGTVVLIR